MKLFFISSDAAGCFGCRWIIATREEAATAGYIHDRASHQLTPALLSYLRSINFPGA